MPLTFEELKSRQGVKSAEKPAYLEKKNILEKAGEFVAPTTTGLITGEKKLDLKTLLGAGLEIGSFALPSSALLKTAALFGRGAKAVQGAKVAATAIRGVKTAEKGVKAAKIGAKTASVIEDTAPLTFEGLLAKTGQIGKKVGLQAKTAAKIGGVSGTMFGAGRALGEEDAGLKEILGSAAIGGLGGAVGGAVLAPTVSGIQAGTRLLSKSIRGTVKRLNPPTAQTAIDDLTNSYLASFVEDKANVNRALDKALIQAKRGRGIVPQTKETLVRELAEAGYIPKVEGELANMRPILDDLANERGKLAGRLDEFLKPIKTKTSLKSLRDRVVKEIEEDFSVEDVTKSLNKIDQIFNVLKRRHGNSITAFEINQLRKEMNQVTGAFKGMTFNDDAFNAVGRVSREALEEVAPAPVVRGINDEITRLFRLGRVADIFNNKKIDAGMIARYLGSFIGTTTAAGVGVTIAGPGGLVIAGLVSQVGAKGLAYIVRNLRFNPRVISVIRQSVNQNQQLKQKLLQEATNKADRALLEKIFREK